MVGGIRALLSISAFNFPFLKTRYDTEAAILRRLALYEKETEPLIAWYLERDRLLQVSGMGSPDAVTARLIRGIDHRREKRLR